MPSQSGIQVPRRRTTIYVVVLVGSIFTFAVLYQRGMAAYEDTQKTFLQSLQVVVETYTTAGYGSDTPWSSTEMNLFVIAMNAIGLVLIFLALPVFLTPVLRNALERTPPTSLERSLSDHVVLATRTARTEPLVQTLLSREIDYAIVEPDQEAAADLHEAGETVLHGAPARRASMEAANLRDARALVIDVPDTADASVVLTAREIDEDVHVVSVVDDPDRAEYHRLAGADAVVSTRPVLGSRLAEMATAAVRTDLGEGIEFGEFRIVELPVSRAGELAGTTVERSGLLDGNDVHLAGLWRDGEFEDPVDDDRVLQPGTVLLVVGREPALTEFAETTMGRPREPASGDTILVGYGEVGRAVSSTLEGWELPYTVVDREDGPDVDVVGDATDPEVLGEAGVEDADALVIAIPDDAETEFATLVARDESGRIHVAARADDEDSVRRLYRAGADYVLPVDDVTGRILDGTVLEDDPVLAADARVDVRRVEAGGTLDGTAVGDAAGHLEGGSRVVAVERDGDVLVDVEDDLVLGGGDRLAVVGTDEDLAAFTEAFA